MTTRDEIELLVRSGESETLEFKTTTGERRAGTQSACAMLNQNGGRILYGVSPDGRLLGQPVSEHTIEEVAAEMARIDPPAFPSIDRVALGTGRDVLVVSVSQGAARPYTHGGISYRRVGNTTRVLSRDEYNRMLMERMHAERRWENEPALGWSMADLDDVEIRRTMDEAIRRGRAEDPGTRDFTELLLAFGLIRDGVLLRAAALLFGRRDRLEIELPQCLLRVARFRGSDRTEFIDNRQLHGNAFDLLLRGERFLRENLPVAGRVTPGLFERVDDPLYPPIALREALANALCHRDYAIGGGSVAIAIYDDRLEVTSSGPLHFGLTAADLLRPHESLPWNPLVARIFYLRGIIESWGRGTIKMVELTSLAGLPAPEIEDAAGCVTVCFHPGRYLAPQRVAHDLTDRQQEILTILSATRRGFALAEIRTRLPIEMTARQIREDLATLRILKLVNLSGYGRGARWKCL